MIDYICCLAEIVFISICFEYKKSAVFLQCSIIVLFLSCITNSIYISDAPEDFALLYKLVEGWNPTPTSS
jgi:hypothetical protein